MIAQIEIFGREKCGICQRFAKRVEEMGFSYNKYNIDNYIVLHDNWRNDGSVEIMAAMHALNNSYPPVIKVNKKFRTFSEAINLLKGIKNGKNK